MWSLCGALPCGTAPRRNDDVAESALTTFWTGVTELMPTYQEPPHNDVTASQTGESGYPWLFFYASRSWVTGLIVTLFVIGLPGAFYIWYSRSGNDTAPDSIAGLSYAIAGTIFLILALVLYSLRRRLRKRAIGKLHAALNWHMFFAITGLILLLMHSFGNFGPVSGTYALYGMIALTLSGLVGRALDRLMPRLIASKVSRVLTLQGEDRIITISQKLQAIVVHNTQEEIRGFPADTNGSLPMSVQGSRPYSAPLATTNKLNTPWDLAYISLEPTQQELDHNAPHYRFVPDKKSAFTRPGAAMPGAQEQISALQDLQSAMQREQFYRYVIRYWRVLHLLLALLTVGLVIWHLIFAAHILFPTVFY
jgi:hypothetical protein